MAQRVSKWAVAGIATVGFFAAAVSAQPLPVGLAKCRRDVGSGLRRLAVILVQKQTRCYQLFLRGKLSPPIDCNDPSTWPGTDFGSGVDGIERARSRLVRLAKKKCAALAPPRGLGFYSCPRPCDSTPITDYDSVATCLQCLAADCGRRAVAAAYGKPPALVFPDDRAAFACQKAIGQALKVYVNLRVKFEQLCQLLKDRDKPGFQTVDCTALSDASHPFNPKFESLRRQVNAIIARCEHKYGVDIGSKLDTCGTDAATTEACVEVAADLCTDGLFAVTYSSLSSVPTPVPAVSPSTP